MSEIYNEILQSKERLSLRPSYIILNDKTMKFDTDYLITLLETKPIKKKTRNYQREEYIFFVSYQNELYQLRFSEIQAVSLANKYGDFFEKFKNTEILISKTKKGKEHVYEIKPQTIVSSGTTNVPSDNKTKSSTINCGVSSNDSRTDDRANSNSREFDTGDINIQGESPTEISGETTTPKTVSATSDVKPVAPIAPKEPTHEIIIGSIFTNCKDHIFANRDLVKEYFTQSFKNVNFQPDRKKIINLLKFIKSANYKQEYKQWLFRNIDNHYLDGQLFKINKSLDKSL